MRKSVQFSWRPDAIVCFADDRAAAARLAARLDVPCAELDCHTFPDGETRVRADLRYRRPAVYRSLDRPNGKIMPLLLAAAALRDQGASQIVLIAPYLAYMRQDRAFLPGEAVSQCVLGDTLAAYFDALVSVDPHLHRTPRLSDMFHGKPARALSAAPAFLAYLRGGHLPSDTLILGPDEESGPLVDRLAGPLGLQGAAARKVRHADRRVEILIPTSIEVDGRPVVIIDDVISSGVTIEVLADELLVRGAGPVDVCATHALCDDATLQRLGAHGIRRLISTDTVAHPTNRIAIADVIAASLTSAAEGR